MPTPSPETEAKKRAALIKHRRIATGMLIAAAFIFLVCEWHLHSSDAPQTWVRFVKAASEAGMVGGLADWFAVTALFRYPLGIKIPHTAIVKRKKDQVGESLGDFVSENFLNAQLIGEKIASVHLPAKTGQWLSDADNAARVTHEAGAFAANVLRSIDKDEAERLFRDTLVTKADEKDWSPILGQGLEKLIEHGNVDPLVEAAVGWMHERAVDSEELITRLINQRAPSWAPRLVNQLVGDKVYLELISWTDQVRRDPNHDARKAILRFITKLAHDLQTDPETQRKVAGIKDDLLHSQAVAEFTYNLWEASLGGLLEALEDPNSTLRTKGTEYVQGFGQRLCNDAELRENLEDKLVRAASWLVDNYGSTITNIIGETIARWDADEAADKIELMVGKDLQFIRMNGTIVGALAGLVIYTISYVLFGG
ncbi:MAG: DUF445 family protein [Corynebacterium sp.]|nr:DUF445 family protein [Corynebacterium sp.]